MAQQHTHKDTIDELKKARAYIVNQEELRMKPAAEQGAPKAQAFKV